MTRTNSALTTVAAVSLLVLLFAACQSYVPREDLAEEYYNLGNAYFRLERYDEASDYYRRALTLSPTLERANYNLARSLIAAGNLSDAISLLEELRASDQESVRLTEALAYAELQAGNQDRAIALYEEVLELSPYRVNALYNLGVLARRAGNHQRAADLLARAGDAAPADLDVQFHLGLALLATEQPDRAIAALERYAMDASEPPIPRLIELSRAYEEARFFSRALDIYSSILDREEQHARALFGRARVLLTGAEEPEEGIAALTSALQAGFSDEQALRELLARDGLLVPGRVREVLEENGALPEESSPDEGEAPPQERTERDSDGDETANDDIRPPSVPPE